MLITLDIFSGRPNPSWLLSAKDADKLLQRVAGRAVQDETAVESVLGFRGFVAAAQGDDSLPAELLSSFRLGGLLPADVTLGDDRTPALTADESDDAVRWLLHTGRHVLDDELQAYVADVLNTRSLGDAPAEPAAEDEGSLQEDAGDARAPCVIANTAYNAAFWNRPDVQPKNNCYNYAMNHRSDTFAQPGRISGHPIVPPITCASVSTAAAWDGCKATCSGSNKNVALVVWPGHDYHWYRRHSNGFWGHKPGSTAARNTDNRGRVIGGALTPQNCDRGPYVHFCGYRYSPTGMRVR
ncbi:hypothetical protein [Sphaerotilus microaerophilus]|uniref:Uncharacterized protein n=1 Tax=Sphaerotilus microaerophilus TaxID=2914710 RepID=A0ABN6PKB5_9BURK|nr:hypothetical protein [Sphaerotilus sp. FB-5]BDI05600.1 hypothetical protein CATMQ487_25700 [Sphaerotilus sp. FB-5]